METESEENTNSAISTKGHPQTPPSLGMQVTFGLAMAIWIGLFLYAIYSKAI